MEGRDLSLFYDLFGYQTVFLPVPYGSKRCLTRSWQEITFTQTQVRDYQLGLLSGNLAVSVGPKSENLVAIDLDLEEFAVLMIRLNPLLRETLCTQGSKGCNFWLRIKGDYPKCIRRFDPKKKFGEWRGGGGYTVVDGRHPAGCDYRILVPAHPIELAYSELRWPDIFDRPELPVDDTELIYPVFMNNHRVPADELIKPDTLIEGLLHRGNKMIISGGSKTYKTWTLIDLAISLAFGGHWLGFQCMPCRVLYINFEIQMPFFMERVNAIKAVKKLPQNDNFLIWTLRGFANDIDIIITELKRQILTSNQGFDVIIWDPIYKVYGPRQENDASDMSQIMNALDHLASEIGASNILGNHFSKGNQAAKEAIDRIGGSGVFGRDPDSILTITPLKDPNSFVVDLILRNNLNVDSFGVRWVYPMLQLDPALDPADLKQPGGRPPAASTSDLLQLLRQFDDQLTTAKWQKLALTELGISVATFYRLKKQLLAAKLIFLSKISHCWNAQT
jgi:AAA domain/Bifunctional DNA primase/polymerase, N-terminal